MIGFFKMLLVSPQTKRSLQRFYLVLKLLLSSRLNKKQNQTPNFQTFHKIPVNILIQHPLSILHSIITFSKVKLSTFFKIGSKESKCVLVFPGMELTVNLLYQILPHRPLEKNPKGLFHASVSTYYYQISFVTTLQIKIKKIQSQKNHYNY